jgi:hypothetical protein
MRVSGAEGGDVSLVEPREEAEALCEEGRLLLWERHDIECRLAGLDWIFARRRDLERGFRGPLTDLGKEIARFDARLRDGIRHFLPFNLYRRSYRDTLPDSARFWWWHELADCDLPAIYAAVDTESEPEHVGQCSHCAAELGRLREVQRSLALIQPEVAAHPGVEELVALFHGELGGEEEQGIDWHLRVCRACREEMEALQRAEELEEEEEEPEESEKTNEVAGDATTFLVRSYRIPPEPPETLRGVAADSAEQHDVVRGLGAEFVGGDDEVKVWIGWRDDRVVLLVIVPDPSAIGEVEITDADSLESFDVRTRTVESDTMQLDLGSASDLTGRRLLPSLVYRGRAIQLPRIDIETEGSK